MAGEASEYPRAEGDVTALGPEVFVSADGAVISFRGEHYYLGSSGGPVGVMAGRLLEDVTDDLLDDRAVADYLDRDDQLASQGLRTLFSSEGRAALRAGIARRG